MVLKKYVQIIIASALLLGFLSYYNNYMYRSCLNSGTKVVIIGATSGIGEALVYECVQRGCHVGATGRRAELLQNLKNKFPKAVTVQDMDIAQPEKAQEQLDNLINTMGGMDIMIINAGIIDASLDWISQKKVIDVNVIGFVAMVSAASDYFIQKGSGHIVGISSLTALRGISAAPVYSASKAFMSNYLDGLRARFNKNHCAIHVTDVKPALVNTAMTQDPAVAKPDFTDQWGAAPEQAAKEICNAIERKSKCVYVTWPWHGVVCLWKILPDWCFHKLF